MATGNPKSIQTFDISDVSGGCNYSDDINALKKNQSPDSLNVEFFNGRIRKRTGELAINTPSGGQGGIDANTKLMLHMDGVDGSVVFTDSEILPKTVVTNGSAQIKTAQSKFGSASGYFPLGGIDANTTLLLHMDGVNGSQTFTDSETTPKTVTANGGAQISTAQSKFGGASGVFNTGIDAFTVLMLHMDGVDASTTFTDSASGAKTVTAHGTTKLTTATTKFGTAAGIFSASGDGLSLVDSADWNFGSGDFTIDGWVRFSNLADTQVFFLQRDDTNNLIQAVLNPTSGTIAFSSISSGSTEADYLATGLTFALNTWYHIAFVRRTTTTFNIFVNGVSQTLTVNTAISTNTLPDLSSVFVVGARQLSGVYDLPILGWMDEFRISKGIARWSTNFITATIAYGSGDYLTMANSTDFDFGAGDFTIDWWVNYSSIKGSLYFQKYQDSSNVFEIYSDTNGGDLVITVVIAGSEVCEYIAGFERVLGTWYHIAFVRNGSNFFIFVNGVSQTLTVNTAIGSQTIGSLTGTTYIGTHANSANYFMDGFLDEFRVSKGVARWTTNFTPPSAPYGVGGYLSVATSADWNFALAAWTIDFWINPDDSGITRGLYSNRNDGNTIALRAYKNANNFIVVDYNAGTWTITGATAISMSAWTHIAVTFDGMVKRLFINGVLDGSVTDSTNLPSSALPITIGTSNALSVDAGWVGYVDEFRISTGIARWTANFTPPSAAYDQFNSTTQQIGFSLVDFSNVNQYHQQVVHFGNSVFAFDRISNTDIILRNGAPFIRSFNAKVGQYLIQTYQDHSVAYYWDGIASSMSILSSNFPGFRRSIEFQGYLIGMGTNANRTRCYYQPIGNIIGDPALYADFFTLTPAPNDDEISDPFLLNGRLYVGTKYSIFRVSFVGGVTVFEFKQAVSDVGVVPNTTQIVITKDYGQVALFLGTDKRIYMFDGANVKAISDLYYYRNRSTPIALDLIDDNYKENSFAVYDLTKRIYRLCITKSAFSTNNYFMNVDVDTFAYYPYDNMHYASGAMCYDALLRPFLVCADYTGTLHKMFIDNPTDNGTAINEYYKSPLVSMKNNLTKKGVTINLDITPSSNANLQVYDRIDYARQWSFRQNIPLGYSRDKYLGVSMVLGSAKLGSEKDLLNSHISINASFNNYQFQLSSDTPTAAAWEVQDMMVDQEVLKFGKSEPQR